MQAKVLRGEVPDVCDLLSNGSGEKNVYVNVHMWYALTYMYEKRLREGKRGKTLTTSCVFVILLTK